MAAVVSTVAYFRCYKMPVEVMSRALFDVLV